ncbi:MULTISPECIES: amylo-alpha-1,6-glucosidase [Halanaerobium]|uniref:Glycogen debranching enzyme (Alpha-1,6-glucosidase) n=1 Tax=Halanaerobium kushneri TaxID=56779 RepID=A0A1N6YBX1_9FIRM|nr:MULTISPECIES: glycogen debranching N-terminal domain-containing protein [Halanaerobium]RCW51655.1 glycogen debranching enzyme [Halanaerobium sp. ST460_2HS_T2]SIR12043.1 Glycogen debranching enzyme (alpha-1,6-glucosidase) [Halanaerobium kushneri]
MDYNVIKNDDIFLITDRSADIVKAEFDQNGLYRNDTRYLSKYNLLLNGEKLLVLKSETKDNLFNEILLTNAQTNQLAEGKILVKRKETLVDNVFYDNFKIKNYAHNQKKICLEIEIDADFLDIFEVRKYFKEDLERKRVKKTTTNNYLKLIYHGLDKVERSVIIASESDLCLYKQNKVKFEFELDAGEEKEITLSIKTEDSSESNPDAKAELYNNFSQIKTKVEAGYVNWTNNSLQVETDNQIFNQFLQRSSLDLKTLTSDVGYGQLPIAGIPWYAVPFGRDSIITALQTLIFKPDLSRATLKTLAAYQGKKIDPLREEEPGKIFHELRFGELANLKKIPHTPYYGTIDATPLFIVLAGEYYRWTGDLEFIKELMPNLELALSWIDKYGDKDNDLFVEFSSQTEDFTVNQGWKDSVDSSINSKGEIAVPPIALAEVQAYVYQAKLEMAEIYQELKLKEKAEKLKNEALKLKERFNQKFWNPEKEIFVLGLDKNKNQIDSLTTNPAHGYYSGIIEEKKGELFIKRLLKSDLNSGRGLRTMANSDLGYNPISYHNGSIWPHDNSLIIEGLKKYGYQKESIQLITDIFKAAADFEFLRLPELYCGFDVNEESKTVEYPTSCSPQAWAAGSAFLFLQTILGLKIDGRRDKVIINPSLPEWLNKIKVKNLSMGDKSLTFEIYKKNKEIKINEIKIPDEIKIEKIIMD